MLAALARLAMFYRSLTWNVLMLQWTLPGTPVLSNTSAHFTVLPNKWYLILLMERVG